MLGAKTDSRISKKNRTRILTDSADRTMNKKNRDLNPEF